MRRILTVTLNPALDLSTTTPRVESGPKLRCAMPLREPGGGGVNVSRAIAKLGHASRTVVAVGGSTGQALQTLLEAEGLSLDLLEAPGETRQSLVVTDAGNGGQYRFILPGPTWDADAVAAALARLAVLVSTGDLVVVSGSLPPGVPPETVETLTRLCADLGAQAAIDVSGAPLAAAAAMTAPGACLIRMDQREAADLLERPEPDAATALTLARRLVDRGAAAHVAVALGADGGILVSGAAAVRTVPPVVPVVSTTGAGDSYLAGLVIALASDWPLDRAAAYATACAADAVTTPGTALCSADGVAALLPQVRTTAL